MFSAPCGRAGWAGKNRMNVDRRGETPVEEQEQTQGKTMALKPLLVGIFSVLAMGLIALVVVSAPPGEAQAEYGDVVINNYSDDAGMRPVVFPHWFHRIRFRCKVCHTDLDFKFKAGGNDINMLKIFDGEFCGACHNGEIAWGVENCVLCHTGVPGMRTRVHHSTSDRLVAPPAANEQ